MRQLRRRAAVNQGVGIDGCVGVGGGVERQVGAVATASDLFCGQISDYFSLCFFVMKYNGKMTVHVWTMV